MKKIFVKAIDGIEFYIPVNATQISENIFQILDSNENLDFSELFEFFPNDIVETKIIEEDIYAFKIIKKGNFKNRKLFEFMFLSLNKEFKLNISLYEEYKEEIQNIKLNENFIYPTILKKIHDFEKTKL